jgi:hypothetical protein
MTTSHARAAVAALTLVSIASLAACTAPTEGGEGTTGSTSEAATCLSCGGPGAGGGTGGSSGGIALPTSTTRCQLLQGSTSASSSKLPFVTQVAPGTTTASTGWASYTDDQFVQAKANVAQACASDPTGIGCFIVIMGYYATFEPWVFENQLADALSAADPSVADVTQSPPLLLASNDPTALLNVWYGVKISPTQAGDADVLALVEKYDAFAQANVDVVSPQLFSCTVTAGLRGAATTSYYVAWDPNCGETTCALTLSRNASGQTSL